MPTRCPLQVHPVCTLHAKKAWKGIFLGIFTRKRGLARQRKRLTVHTILLVNVTAKLCDIDQGEPRLPLRADETVVHSSRPESRSRVFVPPAALLYAQ